MKVLGILGSHQRDGVNGQLLQAVLAGVGPEDDVSTIFLNDFQNFTGHGATKSGVRST